MFRLLALLQLTRAALAFTAIADAWTVLLLRMPNEPAPESKGPLILRMILVSIVSFGLYAFGMSLNDLLDVRRDRVFAKWRPLPSGRIAPRTALVVCMFLLMGSLLAAAVLGVLSDSVMPWPFFFALATAFLIVVYDGVTKYLCSFGIITLGAIRALHCLIGKPSTPVLFLSMILLTHVILVSAVAYRLEGKRPRMRRGGFAMSVVGVLIGNALAVWYMVKRAREGVDYTGVGTMLIGPALAMVAYGAWAWWTLHRHEMPPRARGEQIMLMGLFWLFVYDASILIANAQPLAAFSVILLFLCAFLSFQGIRALGRRMSNSPLQYRTERTPVEPAEPQDAV